MSYTEMSLPTDIAWKRMGVAQDMIAVLDDNNHTNINWSENWRSSISIFYYEPETPEKDYCKRTITYIKVVCTITNHQPEVPKEQGKRSSNVLQHLLGGASDSLGLSDHLEWDYVLNCMKKSYPCYGALVEVAVYPVDNSTAIHDYPYIAAFQPRKREMYQVVTESGEVLSQSGSHLNTRKGTTTTDSSIEGGLGVIHAGVLGDFGASRNTGGIETTNYTERQVDDSREKRESFSHSTNISQLYSLLQSYHLGTNRATFFLQPRPHIQDTHFTFVRGLRRLEGIQEFFLIVNQPRDVAGLKVEVKLDTAHLHQERDYSPRFVRASEAERPENLQKKYTAMPEDVKTRFSRENSLIDTWNNISAWMRFLALGYRNQDSNWPGWDRMYELFNSHPPVIDRDTFAMLVDVAERIPEVLSGDKVALLLDQYEATKGTIYVTSRRLQGTHKPSIGDSGQPIFAGHELSIDEHVSTLEFGNIVYEHDVVHPESIVTSQARVNNIMIEEIGNTLLSSVRSPARKEFGTGVPFLATGFMLDILSKAVQSLAPGDPDIGGLGLDVLTEQGLDPSLTLGQVTDIANSEILENYNPGLEMTDNEKRLELLSTCLEAVLNLHSQ